jgi:hypothetical protein
MKKACIRKKKRLNYIMEKPLKKRIKDLVIERETAVRPLEIKQ